MIGKAQEIRYGNSLGLLLWPREIPAVWAWTDVRELYSDRLSTNGAMAAGDVGHAKLSPATLLLIN
ncbi:hypothetical protein GS3922_09185 [Geobacillus subterraneus]|uniref:Uncharacterized protein n=2 Tax=Geobacillus TaxID=129337 RepID=A0ABN4NGN9_9BACL|nr:hypothetical protein GS3922_09185 [Geobacillus subterraneus]KZS26886.1 hypothetical protein A5418_08265 [Geobacillus subterraneus]OXB88030.1 hypothetical protein B9L21_09075 [Geobacillus uzenensis]